MNTSKLALTAILWSLLTTTAIVWQSTELHGARKELSLLRSQHDQDSQSLRNLVLDSAIEKQHAALERARVAAIQSRIEDDLAPLAAANARSQESLTATLAAVEKIRKETNAQISQMSDNLADLKKVTLEIDKRSALDNTELTTVAEKVTSLQDGLRSDQRAILAFNDNFQGLDDLRKKLELLEIRVNAHINPTPSTPAPAASRPASARPSSP